MTMGLLLAGMVSETARRMTAFLEPRLRYVAPQFTVVANAAFAFVGKKKRDFDRAPVHHYAGIRKALVYTRCVRCCLDSRFFPVFFGFLHIPIVEVVEAEVHVCLSPPLFSQLLPLAFPCVLLLPPIERLVVGS